MKSHYYFLLLLCTGCQLQEYRTTVAGKHIFSQEDSAFYFSDMAIKSRADSFELALMGKSLKFYNAADLSKSNEDEIRLLYDRSFHEPYLISYYRDGRVTIATVDTSNYDQYEPVNGYDTLKFSPKERTTLRVNRAWKYFIKAGKNDSAAMLKAAYGNMIDSLYYWHLRRLGFRQLIRDTVNIRTTTFYIQPTFFEEALTRIDAVNFWKMLIYENSGSTDGSSWTLEVKTGTRHHVTCQVNTDIYNKPFNELCRWLIEYVHIPRRKIY